MASWMHSTTVNSGVNLMSNDTHSANRKEQPAVSREALGKGIFWVMNEKQPILLPYVLHCDINGKLTQEAKNVLCPEAAAKSGYNFNHERLWNTLPQHLTRGHSYRYHPRGRVEIARKKAIIYLNPNINVPMIVKSIGQAFGLADNNGITAVHVKADGSTHYQCHIDDDTIQ